MSTSDFGRNFKALRQREGLTQLEMADALGISEVMVNRYEKQGIMPRKTTLQLIADKFKVTERELVSYSDGLWANTYGLDPHKPSSNKCFAPLLGKVHAGHFEDADILEDEIPIPASVFANHPRGYYLQVIGDCMSRVYPEGCYIFIDPDKHPSNGDIAALMMNGECIMRRIHFGANVLMLSPDSYNDEWDDLMVSDESTVELIGTVVWFQAAGEL